jgi:pimeloyl-ACP methyl ester carboxylesterase
MTVQRTDSASSAPVRPKQIARAVTAPPDILPARAIGPATAPSYKPGMTWGAGAILGAYTRISENRLRTVDRATPRDITVPVGGHSYSVRLWETHNEGTLPTLVVLHGMGGAAATHRPVFQALGSKFSKFVFVEVPGHGASQAVGLLDSAPPPKPFVCADRVFTIVRRALDLVLASDKNIALLGHSLGGYLAVRYANESACKAAVRSVALVSPDGGPYTPKQLEEARVASYVGDSWLKASAMARDIWPDAPLKAQGRAPFLQATYAAPSLRYLLQSDLFQPVLTPAQLATLPRTCFVWGTAEAMQRPEHFGYFQNHLPSGTRIVQPEGLSHGDFNDAPESMVAPLLAFFNQCEP